MPPQPITSVAEFSRILRDDIIPLLEEYCYDDFGMSETSLAVNWSMRRLVVLEKRYLVPIGKEI